MKDVARLAKWFVANPTKHGVYVTQYVIKRNIAIRYAAEHLVELNRNFRLRLSDSTIQLPGYPGSLRFMAVDPDRFQGLDFSKIVIEESCKISPEDFGRIMSRKH